MRVLEKRDHATNRPNSHPAHTHLVLYQGRKGNVTLQIGCVIKEVGLLQILLCVYVKGRWKRTGSQNSQVYRQPPEGVPSHGSAE